MEVLNEHPIGFFDGFDEIYVVEPAAWRNIDPSVWKEHWTSEPIHVDKGLPDSLLNMLWVSGAVRYASDGDGLNVVSAREEDVQRVIALFHGLRPAP